MKFRAHETFFIRKGWLSKGMERVVEREDLFVSKKENPMDVLGIGSNMVKSLRYWLQAVGITEESAKGKRVQKLTPFGEIVYESDRYIEEMGTLQLLQYNLARQKELATSWYYFFNEFNMSEFTREDFVRSLQGFIMMENSEESMAFRSLNDDFTCIVNTYLPRYKSGQSRISPENNIDCPFGELGLVDIADKRQKTYKKSSHPAKTFNPWVVLAVIEDQACGRDEVALNELLNAPCNIGKSFNLDIVAMLDILHGTENTGVIKIIRTAGLDVIHINDTYSFEDCVRRFYDSLGA